MAQAITSLRNTWLSALASAVGSGGKIKAYEGSPPGVSNSAPGALLSTFTVVTFGTPANGVMTVTATADPSCAASGTPGTVRLTTSADSPVMEYTAGVGSGEFNFASAVALGGPDTLTSFTMTAANP